MCKINISTNKKSNITYFLVTSKGIEVIDEFRYRGYMYCSQLGDYYVKFDDIKKYPNKVIVYKDEEINRMSPFDINSVLHKKQKIWLDNIFMKENLLGWVYRTSKGGHGDGLCIYKTKEIIVAPDQASKKGMWLHEIAHALTEGHNHDGYFADVFTRLIDDYT